MSHALWRPGSARSCWLKEILIPPFDMTKPPKIASSMIDQQELFIQQLQTGRLGDLSDPTIDHIEDFLVLGIDSQVKQYISVILNFLQNNLSNLLRSRDINSPDIARYQQRLLRAMHFIRKSALDRESSLKIEQISFEYLQKTSGRVFNQALIVLVDHFVSGSPGNQENLNRLLEWVSNYLDHASQSIVTSDPTILFTIIYSFRSLISGIDRNRGNIFCDRYAMYFLKMARSALSISNQQCFFPTYELIVAKSLRLSARLLEVVTEAPQGIAEIISDIQSMIPDNVRFIHIYQNFLLLICTIMNLGERFEINISTNLLVAQIIKSFPCFVHIPLAKSRRIMIYMQSLIKKIQRTKEQSQQNPRKFIKQFYVFFGSFQNQFIKPVTEILRVFITPDIFTNGLHIELMSQLVSSLEIIRIDLDTADLQNARPFDVDAWLETILLILSIIRSILVLLMRQGIPETNYVSRITPFLVRLFSFIEYLLDIAGLVAHQSSPNQDLKNIVLRQIHVKIFRDKMNTIFQAFVQIIINLPQIIQDYLLNSQMMKMIPQKPYHNFHRTVHLSIVKDMPSRSTYHLSFFKHFVDNFDQLFIPGPNEYLLEITTNIFKDAFFNTTNNINNNSNRNNAINCEYLYRLVLLAICSKQVVLINELVLNFMHYIFHNYKSSKFTVFIELLKGGLKEEEKAARTNLDAVSVKQQFQPFQLHSLLRVLLEDSELEISISLLALYVFPLCAINTNEIEQWIALFLPALESSEQLSKAIPTLFAYAARNVPSWTSKMHKAVQNRFVADIALPLPNASHVNLNYLRSLLSKIPDIATQNAILYNEPRKKKHIVVVENTSITIELMFETISREEKPTIDDINLLFNGFYQYLAQLNLNEATTSELPKKIVQFMIKHDESILENACQQTTPPVLYSLLYFTQKYHKPVGQYIDYIEDKVDLLNNYTMLCYSRNTALVALQIIKMSMSYVPTTALIYRINLAVLAAAQFYYKAAEEVMTNCFFTRVFDSDETRIILKELCNSYTLVFSTVPHKNMRKLAMKCLSFFENQYQFNSTIHENRRSVLNELPNLVVRGYPLFRFNFLFMRSFEDVDDKIGYIYRLIDSLNALQIRNITKEDEKVYEILGQPDKLMMPYIAAKMIIKMIVKIVTLISEGAKANQMWERIFNILVDERFKQFIPYFLKKLKKEAAQHGIRSMPPDICNIFQTNTAITQIPPSPENVMLLKFIAKFTNSQVHQQAQITWLTNCFQSFPQALSVNTNATVEAVRQCFKLVKLIHKLEVKNLEVNTLCQRILDFLLSCQVSLIDIDIPYYIFPCCFPKQTFELLKTSFTKGWNIDLFLLALKFVTHPLTDIFRINIFKIFQDTTIIKLLISYVGQVCKQDAEFILDQCINSLVIIQENSIEYTVEAVASLARMSIRFFQIFFQINEKSANFVPSEYFAFLQLFLPFKLAIIYEKSPELLKLFRDELLPTIIKGSQLFYHPVFCRRFVEFMKLLSEETRKSIYDILFDLQKNPQLTSYPKMLVNQLIADKYKHFPPIENVTIDLYFSQYQPAPIFHSFMMYFTGATIAAQKNVIVRDLNMNPIGLANAHVHALTIYKGINDLSSIRTIPRFFHISKIYTSFPNANTAGFQNVLEEQLDLIPFMIPQSLLCYRNLGQQLPTINHSSRGMIQFILSFSTIMLTTDTRLPDRQFIYVMPMVFNQLLNCGGKVAASRVFELLLYAAILVLRQTAETTSDQSFAMARMIPLSIETYVPHIDIKLIDPTLIGRLTSVLSINAKGDASSNQTRTKFILQLILPLAPLLFDSRVYSFFPVDLLPAAFFAFKISKEMVQLYQKVLTVVVSVGGLPLASNLIKNLYKSLKMQNKNIQPPLASPFATIANWLNDYEADQDQFQNLITLLEVFRPTITSIEIIEIANMKQPMHRKVINMLTEMLDSDINLLASYCAKNPATIPLLLHQSYNLAYDVWRIDWWSLDQKTHLYAFMKLLFPKTLWNYVKNMSDEEAKEFVILDIQYLSHDFDRFIQYYVQSFPMSTLAECFSMCSVFHNSLPMPYGNKYQNIQYLNKLNLCEESLGALKTYIPVTRVAGSFHQLSNYEAAKTHYLEAMQEDPSSYFYSLVSLRSISLNLSLPTTKNLIDRIIVASAVPLPPNIILPFFEDFMDQFELNKAVNQQSMSGISFTSFFSHVYVPFFFRSSLLEEVIQTLKIMTQKSDNSSTNIEDILRIFSINWAKTLDKQQAVSSNFTWRITLLNDFLVNTDPAIFPFMPKIQETLYLNYNALANLLVKSGAIKAGIKQLILSVPNEIIQQGKIMEPKPFKVYQHDLPKVLRFLGSRSGQNFYRLRFNAYVALNDFGKASQYLTAVNAYTGKNWLYLVMRLMNSPFAQFMDNDSIFMKLQQEMCLVDVEHSSLYIAAMMNLLRKDSSLLERLGIQFFNSYKNDQKVMWLKWLPQLFQLDNFSPPFELLIMLFKSLHIQFLLTIYHITYAEPKSKPYIQEFLQKAKQSKEDRKYIDEFWLAFGVFQKYEKDINRLRLISHCHMVLYSHLANGSKIQLNPEAAQLVNGGSLEDLVNFCTNNPPVFHTNQPFTEYNSLTGFKFPTSISVHTNIRSSIESDGVNEACLKLLNIKGDTRSYPLVSPIIYRLSNREQLWMSSIAKYIQNHPSSRTRSMFMYYPASYLVNNSLLLVHSNKFTSLREVAGQYSIPRLITEATQRAQNHEASPGCIKDKKTLDIPPDLLYKWFVSGSEGLKVDFLVMRQSFASYLAGHSFFHSLFNAQMPVFPSILLFNDRQRVCYPEFFHFQRLSHLPLTTQIKYLLPEFTLKGSFATSWHTIADTLYKEKDKIMIILNALSLSPVEKQKSFQHQISMRIDLLSCPIGSETEMVGSPYPFDLLDHLIDASWNAFIAQTHGFSWI